MPIFGSSMEPTLHSGGLLMIEPVDARDIEVEDIIVYNVPSMIREHYNYPPVVAHRVIEVKTKPSLGFRTKGDNTGEDPFTIRPQDLRGTVGDQIPYLGLPLLFFQSQQGTIFTIVALVLLAFFLYGGEITQSGNILHKRIFAPVINEEKRASRLLIRKIDVTEQKMNSTEQALEKFPSAIAEYAQHLSSHTSAIQGLSEASHELKRGAAEQNRVLARLMETMGQIESRKEEPSRTQIAAPEAIRPVSHAENTGAELVKIIIEKARAAHELEKLMRAKENAASEAEKPEPEPKRPLPEAGKKPMPPGCARNRQPITNW